MNKRIILMLMLFIVNSSANADIKLSKYAKVYKGDEGVVVTFVALSPKSEKKALIEVTGIDTELDGLILLYEFAYRGRDEAYVMAYDGKQVTRIRTKQGYWTKWTTLYLPDINGDIVLSYDKKASVKRDTLIFKQRYLEQEKKAVQQQLATFKREKHVLQAKKGFLAMADTANKACGKPFSAKIVWDTVTEQHLKKYNFASYCGAVFHEIAKLCKKSEQSKSAINSRLDSVSCAFGDKLKLRFKDKTLKWITAGGKPNQATFIRNYLMNEL